MGWRWPFRWGSRDPEAPEAPAEESPGGPPDAALGWWFASHAPRALERTREAPDVGRRGLHAATGPLAALAYAKSNVLCRVRLSGTVVELDDQRAATEREVLFAIDAREPMAALVRGWIEQALAAAGEKAELGDVPHHRDRAAEARERAIAADRTIRDARWVIDEGAGRRDPVARAKAEGSLAGATRAWAEARMAASAHEAAAALGDGSELRRVARAVDHVVRGLAAFEPDLPEEEAMARARAALEAEAARALAKAERLPVAPAEPEPEGVVESTAAPPTADAPQHARSPIAQGTWLTIPPRDESDGPTGRELLLRVREVCFPRDDNGVIAVHGLAFRDLLAPRACFDLLVRCKSSKAASALLAAIHHDPVLAWPRVGAVATWGPKRELEDGLAWTSLRVPLAQLATARPIVDESPLDPFDPTLVLRASLASSREVRAAAWALPPSEHDAGLLVVWWRGAEAAIGPALARIASDSEVCDILAITGDGPVSFALQSGAFVGTGRAAQRLRDALRSGWAGLLQRPIYDRSLGLVEPALRDALVMPNWSLSEPLAEIAAELKGIGARSLHPLLLDPLLFGILGPCLLAVVDREVLVRDNSLLELATEARNRCHFRLAFVARPYARGQPVVSPFPAEGRWRASLLDAIDRALEQPSLLDDPSARKGDARWVGLAAVLRYAFVALGVGRLLSTQALEVRSDVVVVWWENESAMRSEHTRLTELVDDVGWLHLWGPDPLGALLAKTFEMDRAASRALKGWTIDSMAPALEIALQGRGLLYQSEAAQRILPSERVSRSPTRPDPPPSHVPAWTSSLATAIERSVIRDHPECPKCNMVYDLPSGTLLASTVCGVCGSRGLLGHVGSVRVGAPDGPQVRCPNCAARFRSWGGTMHVRCPACAQAVAPIHDEDPET